jgi:hypothetical protein
LRGRFYYEGQCHMPLRFSLLVSGTGAGWLRVRGEEDRKGGT